MGKIKIAYFTIKQVKDFLEEKGLNRSHLQIWDFFKSKATNGVHYKHDVKGTNLEIKEEGILFYHEYLQNQDKFKNKIED
jgi:hypothetical protein